MVTQCLFGFIALCFFTALSQGKNYISRKDAFFLRLALFLTMLADFSMLFFSSNIAGVIIFCFVQISYNLRYGAKRKTAVIAAVAAFAIAVVVVTASSAMFASVEMRKLIIFLALPSLIYCGLFASSLFHAVKAFRQRKYPRPNGALVIFGMFSFAICDINVALYQLTNYKLILNAAWFFYAPAQIALALSAIRFKGPSRAVKLKNFRQNGRSV
ncbi:MAG: hypothetical protein LBL35_08225 [Clostridiales bacterium]|jgi:hypothetical protein|nr:hypothetical protein [Clostridiales bacterium]